MEYEYKIEIYLFRKPHFINKEIKVGGKKIQYTNAFSVEISIPPERYTEIFTVKSINKVNKVLLTKKIQDGITELIKKGNVLPQQMLYEFKQILKSENNHTGDQVISKGKIEIFPKEKEKNE